MQLVETNPLEFAFSTQTKPALTPLTTKEKKKKKTLHSHITTLLLLHHPLLFCPDQPLMCCRPTGATHQLRRLLSSKGSSNSPMVLNSQPQRPFKLPPCFLTFSGLNLLNHRGFLNSERYVRGASAPTLRSGFRIRWFEGLSSLERKQCQFSFWISLFFYLVICFVSPFYFF